MIEDLLARLVAVPSPYPEEGAIGDLLADLLQERGFTVERQRVVDGRANVLGSKGSGPSLLFLGHMDTVAPEPGWEDPYTLRRDDGRILGLGAHDMKGGIACLLSALEGCDTPHAVKVAFTVDEENVSQGAHVLDTSGFLDDVVGCVSVESAELEGPEEACLGRRGRTVLQVDLYGRPAHAAAPKDGANAVTAAASVLQALDDVPSATHEHLGHANMIPLGIHAEARGLTVPERCTLTLDRHLVPPETPESALAVLREGLPDMPEGVRVEARFADRPTPFLRPYWTDPDSAIARVVAGAIRTVVGKDVVWRAGASVADENAVGARGIPTVVYGPLGGRDHTRHEWVDASSLPVVRDVLARVLAEWTPPVD
ncbi:MAG: M20/M25/M40 family metallo-hydrolase [Methanopyri archaeon]|jgi:acetylornithine deacetylase/succinyl-diaminopimelate desuccinylase-like protein|nr:M20/M25/M40 family metallo-hydrolase [Methanopyri archaeon]